MKVLQVCSVDFTLQHFLMPLIHAIELRQHQVIVACSDGPWARQAREGGLQVEEVPFSRHLLAVMKHVKAYFALVRLLRREKFDIVHVHTPVAAAIARIAAWRVGGSKVVYTAHGFYFHDEMLLVFRWFFIGIEWALGHFTDLLLTQSAEDGRDAERYHLCRGGVVRVIGNGVNPEIFFPSATLDEREILRSKYGIGNSDCIIVSVGRLVAEKGYRELLAAMAHVDGVLWLVGERLGSDHSGGVEEDLERALADPARAKRIRVLGHRNDVGAILRAADIFVLPSYREGMPRSIIEAMMTALPVIATDIRGCREEVIHNETGLLVAAKSVPGLVTALTKMVDSPLIRQKFGDAGRDRALRFYNETESLNFQLNVMGL